MATGQLAYMKELAPPLTATSPTSPPVRLPISSLRLHQCGDSPQWLLMICTPGRVYVLHGPAAAAPTPSMSTAVLWGSGGDPASATLHALFTGDGV